MLIQPVRRDEDLRSDINMSVPDSGVFLWWLGQSGFLIKSSRGTLLVDPYLSDSLTTKYLGTDRPHTRMTERCIAPERLPTIDWLSTSHNHTDHLDAETLVPILMRDSRARLLVPAANREFVLARLRCTGDRLVDVNDGESVTTDFGQVHGIPAAHNQVDRDEQGRCRYLGYVFDFGTLRIYHAGDTLLYPGMVDRLQPFQVNVALLPINGDRPERRVAGNLRGDEAARLAHDMGAKLAIPCHYDMFQFNTESPELFQQTCERLGQAYRILSCGERCEIHP